jgi:hypothetical protein
MTKQKIGRNRVRIEAHPKKTTRSPRALSVIIEMDQTTKVIDTVTINRRLLKNERVATITFRLTETGYLPDARYTLEGNLDMKDAKVLGPDAKIRRGTIMKSVLDKRGF